MIGTLSPASVNLVGPPTDLDFGPLFDTPNLMRLMRAPSGLRVLVPLGLVDVDTALVDCGMVVKQLWL